MTISRQLFFKNRSKMCKFALMNKKEILEKYWGYTSFRLVQEQVIDSVLQGFDTLAIMPTGGGKSLCFQVPALMSEGLCLVITPLIALMKDQVQNLEDRGIKAIAIYAGMNRREVDTALNNAAYGDVKFLYVSPERLGTFLFQSYLEVLNINYIVVDEAHCISSWGYDFRPDYLNISKIRVICDAPLIALTATATETVAQDIIKNLVKKGTPNEIKTRLENFKLIKSGFERPNLSYIVRHAEDKIGQLLNICRGVKGSGIVYMRNRSKCEEIANVLISNGENAAYYHAGLDSRTRSERQAEWKSGNIRIMVCTNAFGMGIDKPDVRFVVHLGPSDSIEAYFQEAGRAGRDSKRSYAVLLWNEKDIIHLRKLVTISFPSLEIIEDIYQKIHIYLQIPYDQGENCQTKFELEDFAKRFNFQRHTVHYAIRYLELSDHLTYTKDVDENTRIKILCERGDLYNIRFNDDLSLAVLELLMRSYPGIFSFTVAIDEVWFSSKLDLEVTQLRQILYSLSIEHIIKYIPCSHNNILSLHHSRLHPGNLNLQKDKYDFLKTTTEQRTEAIIDYMSGNQTCRQSYLLSYFGQKSTSPCTNCDICRSKANTKARIIEYFNTNPYNLEAFKAYCDNPQNSMPSNSIKVLRDLINEGELEQFQ